MMIGTWLCLRSCRQTSMPLTPGQHHVEQHEVGLDDVEALERLEAVAGDLDAEALTRAGRSSAPRRSSPRPRRRAPSDRLMAHLRRSSADSADGRRRCRRDAQHERGAFALLRRHDAPSPPWLVATWRTIARPEPGAAGVAAAGPVDAVEALEDPVDGRGRDADAVVGDHELDPARPRRATRDLHAAAGSLYLTRVLDQVAERRDELAAIAEHA